MDQLTREIPCLLLQPIGLWRSHIPATGPYSEPDCSQFHRFRPWSVAMRIVRSSGCVHCPKPTIKSQITNFRRQNLSPSSGKENREEQLRAYHWYLRLAPLSQHTAPYNFSENNLFPSSGELKITSNQINHHKTNTSDCSWPWPTLQISQFSDRHFGTSELECVQTILPYTFYWRRC